MFERYEGGERVILVQAYFHSFSEQTDIDEGRELALSAGADIVGTLTCKRSHPDPKHFIGSGKVLELKQMVLNLEAELIIFNHQISPGQERELEKALSCRVIDRTGLILDIFAKRARTFEGKLQVELAQLQYMSTRLVRGWTHLERQRGGGIGMTGPGETQLELDRRLLQTRVKQLQQKLIRVRKTRELGRKARKRSETLTVSLVGYTNVGKSTLFNQLTQSDVYAKNQLFATLDPTLRRVTIEGLGEVVFVDTVGFIRHLPHHLVEAFSATLEETVEADLLLHVVDATHPEKEEMIIQVNDVLEQIGASDMPTMMVMNKIDLDEQYQPHITYDAHDQPVKVWLSAFTGEGLPLLTQALFERLSQHRFVGELFIEADRGGFRAVLHALGAIQNERFEGSGYMVELSIDMETLKRLAQKFKVKLNNCIG